MGCPLLLLLPHCFSIDDPQLLHLDAAAPAVGQCLDGAMATMVQGRLLELFGDGVAVLRSSTLQVGGSGCEGGDERDTVCGSVAVLRSPTLQVGGSGCEGGDERDTVWGKCRGPAQSHTAGGGGPGGETDGRGGGGWEGEGRKVGA